MAVVLGLAGGVVSVQSHAATYILLASTTDVRDSGLLDYLDPLFTADTGIEVRYTAVGTGLALALARQGDADALLVHAPPLELAFMAQGQGLCRSPLMENAFLLVGPPSDPAGIRGLTNATLAFRQIWRANATFVSRADESGTNVKELQIWSLAGYTPTANDSWYLETGLGMADTLHVASERGGYTLTDAATYYALASGLDLQILVQGDPVLLNVYHVLVVNPVIHPALRTDAARSFAEWLTAPRGQALIASYQVAGHRLYTPTFFAGTEPEEC